MKKTLITGALDDGNIRIDLGVSGIDGDSPFRVTDSSIKGFWSTPTIKTNLTESQIRNGSHGLSHSVRYSSRVVTIPFIIKAKNRAQLDDYKTVLQRFVGTPNTRFEVFDGSNSTYVEGMLAVEYARDIDERVCSGEMTLTCVDAERKSVDEYSTTIGIGISSIGGGLSFGSERKGLVFPMNFGKREITGVRNTVVISNGGSYQSDIRIDIHGELPGALFEWYDSDGNRGYLEFDGFISGYQTIVLDSKTETATLNGTDLSGQLRYRDFPHIPAGGNVRITMLAVSASYNYGNAKIRYNYTWM